MTGLDAPPTFLPARPVTAADLAALTERVRRRVLRWFLLTRLLEVVPVAAYRQPAVTDERGSCRCSGHHGAGWARKKSQATLVATSVSVGAPTRNSGAWQVPPARWWPSPSTVMSMTSAPSLPGPYTRV